MKRLLAAVLLLCCLAGCAPRTVEPPALEENARTDTYRNVSRLPQSAASLRIKEEYLYGTPAFSSDKLCADVYAVCKAYALLYRNIAKQGGVVVITADGLSEEELALTPEALQQKFQTTSSLASIEESRFGELKTGGALINRQSELCLQLADSAFNAGQSALAAAEGSEPYDATSLNFVLQAQLELLDQQLCQLLLYFEWE